MGKIKSPGACKAPESRPTASVVKATKNIIDGRRASNCTRRCTHLAVFFLEFLFSLPPLAALGVVCLTRLPSLLNFFPPLFFSFLPFLFPGTLARLFLSVRLLELQHPPFTLFGLLLLSLPL